MILDPDFPVFNDKAIDICFEGIKKVYELDTKIHEEHSSNVKIHN